MSRLKCIHSTDCFWSLTEKDIANNLIYFISKFSLVVKKYDAFIFYCLSYLNNYFIQKIYIIKSEIFLVYFKWNWKFPLVHKSSKYITRLTC